MYGYKSSISYLVPIFKTVIIMKNKENYVHIFNIFFIFILNMNF